MGAIYMIGLTGLPAECLSTEHEEINWSESASLTGGSVGTAQIADGSVTTAKLSANAVGSAQIADNAVGSSEIAGGAVGSAEVADNSLTAADLAPRSVGSSEIATDAVGLPELANLVAVQTHTLGWGQNPPCGTAWTSGAITVPGVQPGDQVVMIQMWGSSTPSSSWARQYAYVDGANSIRVRLTIESTCPGTTNVGQTPVVFLVFRP